MQAIPERDRTDEEWDELNELEIRTAPGNRESDRPLERTQEKRGGQPGTGRRMNVGAKNGNGARPDARPQEGKGRSDGRPPKRQHRRPKRPSAEGGGNGNGNGNGGGNA